MYKKVHWHRYTQHRYAHVTHYTPQSTQSGNGRFLHTFNHDKISTDWWGWGGHSIYHHVQSCSVRSSWEGRYTPSLASLPLNVLCVTHSGYLFVLIRERQLGLIFLKDFQYSFVVAGSPSHSCSCWVRPVSSWAPSSRPWITSARTSSSCTPTTASLPRSSR